MKRSDQLTRLIGILLISSVLVSVSGCAEQADLNVVGDSYTSQDGAVSEFDIDDRADPIDYTGQIEDGQTIAAEQYRGQVVVVNFWYAACAPCREEAPWLEELNQQFAADGLQFLGVNVRDGAATAQTFADSFGITYPSVIDTDGAVAFAFTGVASPTAVPTTVVLDRQGRPASRIVGILDQAILDSLIDTALAEPSEDQ